MKSVIVSYDGIMTLTTFLDVESKMLITFIDPKTGSIEEVSSPVPDFPFLFDELYSEHMKEVTTKIKFIKSLHPEFDDGN